MILLPGLPSTRTASFGFCFFHGFDLYKNLPSSSIPFPPRKIGGAVPQTLIAVQFCPGGIFDTILSVLVSLVSHAWRFKEQRTEV